MKITLVSHSDSTGGAAIACRRLFHALAGSGIDARLLVQEKKSNERNIIGLTHTYFQDKIRFFRFAVEYLYFNKIIKSPSAESSFSPAWWGIDISKNKEITEADILHLHWIQNSFLNLKSLDKLFKLNKPIVWHLHDMWAFTGGCHYSGTCTHYLRHCGNCPFLKKSGENDLSNKIWEKKSKSYQNANLTIVTPSKWLAELARQSGLLKSFTVHVIPNSIDTATFTPANKNEAKQKLGLDIGIKYLLFAAMNTAHKRKGFEYLRNALALFKNENPLATNIELLIVGKCDEKIKNEFGFKINQLGVITDENKMVTVYNAAEAFLIPSLEDNLPNTVLESLACGTPVIGFSTGGIPEMIHHLQNGYIAEYLSSADLARGIAWVLNHPEGLAQKARTKVMEKFSNAIVASQYNSLFQELLPTK